MEGEECDDGNKKNGDGCSSDCQLESTHACMEAGQACVYCNFTVLPQPLSLSCEDTSLDEAVSAWTDNAGGAEVVNHSHCGTAAFIAIREDIRGSPPGCYTKMFIFRAMFNEGKVDETVAGSVIVYDVEKPTFDHPPLNATHACHSLPPMADLNATDTCMSTAPHITKSSVRTFEKCPHTYTVEQQWLVEDDCGNHDSAVQIVNVYDDMAPTFQSSTTRLQCSGNISRDIEDIVLRHADAEFVDNCDSIVLRNTRIVSMQMNKCSGTGIVQLHIAGSDRCGNTKTQIIYVDIVHEKPPLPSNMPHDTTAECNAVPAMPSDVVATDTCSGKEILASAAEFRVNGRCNNEYTLERMFTFVDDCGNAAQRAHQVFVKDTTPPVITRNPEPLVLECHSKSNDLDIAKWLSKFGGAHAWDECSNTSIFWSHDYDYVKDQLDETCESTTVVTFTVMDDCGITTTVNASIILKDTQPPIFEATETNIILGCHELRGLQPSVVDECSSQPSIWSEDEVRPGRCSSQFGLIRTWTAQDNCGFNSTLQQAITVTDTDPPDVKVKSRQIMECSAADNMRNFEHFLAQNASIQVEDCDDNITWFYSDSEQYMNTSNPRSLQRVSNSSWMRFHILYQC